MIMRSLSHRRPRGVPPCGERGGPVVGPMHKGAFPPCGEAMHLGLASSASLVGAGFSLRSKLRGSRREQAERATQSNNYWSSTTYQNNPNNAWNVNYNDGNVNNNNKNNNNYVRAVRGG